MWIGLGVAVVLLVGYALYVVVSAHREVKDAPRTPMFSCDKHGLVPMQYTLKLNVFGNDVEYCPLCYEDRIKESKSK